ncbi:MAG TPA: beta-L-arabinofuranosidase domain-containing protein [Humisphaera sp.]|jgi:hypothetical protein|nr:beta-L-arabinofuranosidase domain-containing protein [Humisphaera sp.]
MLNLPISDLRFQISVVLLSTACLAAAQDIELKQVASPPVDKPNSHYVSNRAPLAVSPFVKLPIGQIKARGWLANELALEASGMTGHMEDISRWCKFDDNAWVDPQTPGKPGWEELPYWLKGYGDLGYVLGDAKINNESRRWIEAILKTQREDGWFGPRHLLASRDCNGKADLWPNMLALSILQSFYEATGDARVIPFMTKYFKWELDYPDKDFLLGYWPKIRGGDNLESVYWLYNRTGDAWLLALAKKIHTHTANWTGGVANLHGVNFCQSFREPAEYGMQAADAAFFKATENDYEQVMQQFGQVPGGMFGADENARRGFGDPRQGAETCSMAEFMHSFEILTRISGSSSWSDRCEDVAFNSFPAASTPDQTGLHYLTCPNQISLDPADKSPGIQNRGTMFSYSPGAVYRCCEHNVAMGWPYYAEELWLATADNGLAASLYAASEVSAKVGDGTEVKLVEETQYPFGETINLRLSTSKPVTFPLYLRVPAWCAAAEVSLNDSPLAGQGKGGGYIVIDREWAEGDHLTLHLPMRLSVRVWEKNKNSVSIDRGPITYALKIGEKWERYGGTDAWPDMQVLPTTAWNYGLVLDPKDPLGGLEFVPHSGPIAANPFTQSTAPSEIRAKARKIAAWKADAKGLVGTLQQSPIQSDSPEETVTLIPMGAARLRISQFPVIGNGPDAHEWKTP